MNILHDLYQGNIAPYMHPIKSDEYKHLTDKIIAAENLFSEGLSKQKYKQYEEHTDLILAREAIVHEKMFIEGFRLCIKMILASIDENGR